MLLQRMLIQTKPETQGDAATAWKHPDDDIIGALTGGETLTDGGSFRDSCSCLGLIQVLFNITFIDSPPAGDVQQQKHGRIQIIGKTKIIANQISEKY